MTGTRNFYIRMMSVFLVCLLVIAASGVSQWAGIAQAAGTWTAKDPAVNTDLNRVEYANGRWVSVGNFGQITTSTNDGETWAAQTKTGTHLGLKYVDWLGKWIIAGSEGRIYTSSNGTAWNLQTSGMEGAPYPDSDLYSVASSADHLVVVGGGGTVLVSADGISWAKQTKLAGDLYNVTYGNGKFVAVGDAGLIYTSPDGYVWTPETSGTGQVLLGVAYGGTTFTAVGLSGMILTSPNGTSWTPQIVPGFTSDLFSVSYGGGKFMASGVGGTLITSSNGIAWATETTGFADRWMNHASYGNGVFLAVGQNGKLIKQSAPLSTNTNLTSLNLSVGTLAPPFSSGTTMYSASVGNSTASVDVTPTVEDANATVTVNGSAVTSGTAQTVPLNVGQHDHDPSDRTERRDERLQGDGKPRHVEQQQPEQPDAEHRLVDSGLLAGHDKLHAERAVRGDQRRCQADRGGQRVDGDRERNGCGEWLGDYGVVAGSRHEHDHGRGHCAKRFDQNVLRHGDARRSVGQRRSEQSDVELRYADSGI